MKGLLLKDWFVIWKQCKYLLIVPIVFMLVSAFGNDTGFFAAFGSLLLAMLPMTVMGLDERSKWQNYALTMPFSRQDLVISKYVLALIGLLSGVALNFILLLIGKTAGIVSVNAFLNTEVCLVLGGLYISFSFPILFKFGTEKGRLWLLVSVAVIAGGGGALFSYLESSGFQLSDIQIPALPVLFPLLIVILLLVSAWISVRLFDKKEF